MKELVAVRFPQADKILVVDNLNIHAPAAFY
jgi:hypothetical protein